MFNVLKTLIPSYKNVRIVFNHVKHVLKALIIVQVAFSTIILNKIKIDAIKIVRSVHSDNLKKKYVIKIVL